MGRSGEDIVSTFATFLLHNRDARLVTLYLDNCAGQNKQWALFSALVYLVNSEMIQAEKITLKYLVSGHTHMSADSAHSCFKDALLRRSPICDFDDYVNAVGSSRIPVKVMQPTDFKVWPNGVSQYQLNQLEDRPLFRDISSAEFRRGSTSFFLGRNGGKRKEFRVLKKNFDNMTAPNQKSQRGVNAKKKTEIIEKLLPLMPSTRRAFWHDLRECKVPDLCSLKLPDLD